MVAITVDEVVAPVEGLHLAIMDRWFGIAGPHLEPVGRLAGGFTSLIYGTVRLAGSAVGATISVGSELVSDRFKLRPLWETSKGRYVQSIVNSVWGERLEDEKSPLRLELSLRDSNGASLPVSRSRLRRAFPNPKRRLVVLLHGLGETERYWGPDHSPLLQGLRADGFSILGLRYNTGRAVADNGSDLAGLLEAVRKYWPVRVGEVALIGHSMGGLVAQAAVVSARSSGYRWADITTHLVAMGTPHLGSPIEKGVETASRSLGTFPETRPLATFLDGRSAGIKDLRHGRDERPEGVRYHVVAGVITAEPGNPLGVLLGDLVVRVGSAKGSSRQRLSSDVLVVASRHHGNLLGDPNVALQTRKWLTPTA